MVIMRLTIPPSPKGEVSEVRYRLKKLIILQMLVVLGTKSEYWTQESKLSLAILMSMLMLMQVQVYPDIWNEIDAIKQVS